MRSYFVAPILLTTSVLRTMLEVLDGCLTLYLRTVLVCTLFILILVGRHLLNVGLDALGLRLLLLNHCVYLIMHRLILLEYLVVTLNLFLVCVYVLDNVDAALTE